MYPVQLLLTGSLVAGSAALRTAGRWLRLSSERAPSLWDLTQDSISDGERAATAHVALRDEVTGFVRDLAEAAWLETRRSLLVFEERTRAPLESDDAGPARPHRVKR